MGDCVRGGSAGYVTNHAASRRPSPWGKSSNRCGSDTADFYSGMQGQLQSMGKSLCLTADPSGIVTAIACVQPSAFSLPLSAEEQEVMERQTWAVVQVGGRVGHRLQNAHTRGCLH